MDKQDYNLQQPNNGSNNTGSNDNFSVWLNLLKSVGKSNPPITKRCRICKLERLLSEFDFANKAKDKRASICKTCEEERRYTESVCRSGPEHTNSCYKEFP